MFNLFQFDWLSSIGLSVLLLTAYPVMWINAHDIKLAFKSAGAASLAVLLVVESLMRFNTNLGAIGL